MAPCPCIIALALFGRAAGRGGGHLSGVAHVGSDGNVLLQRGAEVGSHQEGGLLELEDLREAGLEASDARFLIHATFGPTKTALEAMSGKAYATWIQEQVALPSELHREHYRLRSNPWYNASLPEQIGRARSPCAPGAKWHNFALVARDIGSSFELRSGKLYVDGVFRTDVQGPPLASSWSGLGEVSGFLCAVQERVGGDVQVAASKACTEKQLMPNLRLWLADDQASAVVPLSHAEQVRPDVFVGDVALDAACNAEDRIVARYNGLYLVHDSRLELEQNSLEMPSRRAGVCVPSAPVNERSCRAPTFAASPRAEQGLTVQVWRRHQGQKDFVDLTKAGGVLAEFVVPSVDFSHTGKAFSGFPLKDYFAARFTSSIHIEQQGTYEFWLSSDDGSRLTIGSEVIVENGGTRSSMSEKTGSIALAPGSHPLVIDYFRASGTGGLVLQWSGPDTSGAKTVVPARALSTSFRAPDAEGCYIACGSAGEVANEPARGHHFAMYTTASRRRQPVMDRGYDNRYAGRMSMELSKSSIWVAKALGAKDQLRQRMAWAVSQIFVVSVQGLGFGYLSEAWLNFYDIFVRSALGNFRDILLEVTYSPLMGKYLTHSGSSSYAFNRNFPNENYAREVMQLFTVGLDQVSPDGTPLRDDSGQVLPSYSNDQILNFARVFTGFAEQPDRGNIETSQANMNLIDPMQLRVERHDIFPKPDLNSNFLGDGFPSCGEALPPLAFLRQGARFEFRGFAGAPDAVELSPASALFQRLCASSDGQAPCHFASVVELEEQLECTGAECQQTHLHQVVVAGAHYVLRAPVCVHRFFHESTARAGASVDVVPQVPQPGYCVGTEGSRMYKYNMLNRVKLDKLDGNDETRQQQCLSKCRAAGGSGCEMIYNHKKKGCYVHMGPVASGSGTSKHLCWVFDSATDALLGHSYQLLPAAVAACPESTAVTSLAECREAVQAMGLVAEAEWAGTSSGGIRPGCSWSGKTVYWNYGTGKHQTATTSVCRAHVAVNQDGELELPDGGSKLAVQWEGPVPAAGTHLVRVTTSPLFSRLPTREELQTRAFLGSHGPTKACFQCSSSEVKAFGEPGSYDQDTVFELDGRFYRNVRSIVNVTGGVFRNPPVFLRSTADEDAERSAHAEVRALLEHLFHHSNTPVFVGKRLIQRFTTSNPSPQYISAVGAAFRSGEYSDLTFSGQYGDLGATAAAILLHAEAREQQAPGQSGAFDGALREPLLKVMHLLRAMEYEDVAGDPVVFRKLQDVIGQFPYEAPSVFNFYLADYQLPAMEPEPEAEGEEEEEAEMEMEEEAVQTRVSPELQIFTPAFFVGYLNGISSLTQSGVSEDCAGPEGAGLGILTRTLTAGRSRDICPQGRFMLEPEATVEAMATDLDVLLTGGRLTPVAKAVVQRAAVGAARQDRLQAAALAVAMTAEFNTLGDPAPLDGVRGEVVGEAPVASKPYKAAIMLFFGGGADTFNLLVPMNCELYDEYKAVRADLALAPSELMKISTDGQPCSDFGIHGALPFLRSLYNNEQAAFISNVGNLVHPTTVAEHKAKQGERCFGLFSHSDQQNAAQTMKCQEFGTAAQGAGGRIADVLSGGTRSFLATSFSLAGASVWSKGVDTQREIVDENDIVGFHQYEEWREGIHNITAQRHGNAYAEAYAKAFVKAIETTETLGRIMDAAKLKTAYTADSKLSRQLRQVAKLIQTHEGRNSERDFFYVSVGGWDMHSNMKESLATKFLEVNDALSSFVSEMKAQSNWEKVVLFSSSEFGRTLDSNGGGSDHGWAGNHFVIGGSLRGQRVFNAYPSSVAAGSSRDLGRGRLIPEYPWESMLVPIAEWMGVEQAEMTQVFPNLGNFDASLIVPTGELFKA